MKNTKIVLVLMLVSSILYSELAKAQNAKPNPFINFSFEAQSLNYIGNFSGITYEQEIGNDLWLGASIGYLHNRAEIPTNTYKKVEHRFKAYSFSERLRYSVYFARKINKSFIKFGDLKLQLTASYMNTTFRNTYRTFSHYDTVIFRDVYDRMEIKNGNINCMDVVVGFNLKSPIVGNLFLNTTASAGVLVMHGFYKYYLGSSTIVRPNYSVSIGLGYTIRKRQKK